MHPATVDTTNMTVTEPLADTALFTDLCIRDESTRRPTIFPRLNSYGNDVSAVPHTSTTGGTR